MILRARCRWVGFAVLLVAAVVVAVLSSPACRLFGADEEIFQLVGQSVADGGKLYREVFDHKGPFFLWLYIAGWNLAGEWGYWILFSSAWTLSVIVFFFGMLRRQVSPLAATGCALAALFYPIWPGYPEGVASMLALLSMGILFYHGKEGSAGWPAALIGVCAAAVFYSKQTNIGFFCGVGLFFLLDRRFGDFVKYAVGGVAGLAVGCILMVWSGTWQGYIDCNWAFNARYAIPFGFWMFKRAAYIFNKCGSEIVFGLAVAGAVMLRRDIQNRTFWSGVLACCTWFLLDTFAVIRGWGVCDQQIRSLAFGFIILLPFVYIVSEKRPTKNESLWLWAFLFAIVFPPVFMSIHAARHVGEVDAPRRALIAELGKLPDAPILVWENRCRFQLETHRPCLFAPYVQVVPLVVQDGVGEQERVRLMSRLHNEPFILLEGQNCGVEWMRGIRRYSRDNITDVFYREVAAVRDEKMIELPSPDPDFRLYVSKALLPPG